MCKSCSSKVRLEYRANNYDKVTAIDRKSYLKRREAKNRRNREYQIEHKEEFKAYVKQYLKDNPERVKKYNIKRRGKTHTMSEAEWKSCKEYFGYQCAYCGLSDEEHKRITNGHQLHKEHVVFNGENDLSNCVPSCRSCNSQKWEFSLSDWYTTDNPNFTQERLDKVNKWINEDYKKYMSKSK